MSAWQKEVLSLYAFAVLMRSIVVFDDDDDESFVLVKYESLIRHIIPSKSIKYYEKRKTYFTCVMFLVHVRMYIEQIHIR